MSRYILLDYCRAQQQRRRPLARFSGGILIR